QSERDQLQSERDQSEKTDDKIQLQERNNALTKDRDMLRDRVSVLTNEKVALEERLSKCELNICQKIWKSCPEGWRLLGSSCYFLSTQMKTWEEIRLDCLNRGADLMIIKNKEEQVNLVIVNSEDEQVRESVFEGRHMLLNQFEIKIEVFQDLR
uniref:C-type lectin domain-containing protein n=1 Tax=Salmo trutta TaxID=8032 RepID=A0A673VRF0_SALTR